MRWVWNCPFLVRWLSEIKTVQDRVIPDLAKSIKNAHEATLLRKAPIND